jgi:Flp pilus assembly protein TadD
LDIKCYLCGSPSKQGHAVSFGWFIKPPKKTVLFSKTQLGLWNEALYRWQKATELDPTYAAACNNLAIAYEHDGKFDDAKKAYEKALQLEPKNLMIRQNYDLFKEINDRTKRRAGK